MVVDMLTSAQEQIPPCVAPMEEDSRNPNTACCPSHHGDHHPQDVPHAPDFHRSDQPGSSSASRSPKTFMLNRVDDAHSTEQQCTLSSGSHSTERNESQHRQPAEKSTRSCKRKLELTSLCLGLDDATKAQDSEKKGLESPPPAKRWVIGPLFQSFKSKMASFTEIVMSPVRLFKTNELPARTNSESLSATRENKEDEEADYKKDVSKKENTFLKKEQTKLPVVQRWIFDTDSSKGNGSEQNKGTISQNGSEHGRDSVPEDGGSSGSVNSASSKSTNQVTEAVRDLNVERGSRDDKQNCESKKAGPVEGADSIRTSLKKCPRNTEQAKKSKSRTQDQPLPKKLRQPTAAVRKRKKGRGPERSGLAEKEDRTEQEEESSTITQKKTTLIQTLKGRKGRVSDECVSTCSSGDFQLSGLNSSKSSEREETGLMRASRSRTKKENNGKCTLVALDSSTTASPDLLGTNLTNASTPAGGLSSSGSVMWASSCMTRQCKNNNERKCDVAESCCSDPEERLRSSNKNSESKPSRRNNIRQAKHKSATSATSSAKKALVSKKSSNTRRGKRGVDAFEDQGMSMSLTLKVGSGLDGEKDTSPIMTCGITTKGKKTGEGVILADTSCPARTPYADRFCVKVADVDVEKAEADQQRGWFVYSEIREEELEQEDDPKRGQTSSGSIRLMRSLSCPDITSLHHGDDAPAAPINDKNPYHPSPLKNLPHLIGDAPSPFKRPRRHTVCSMEIEREIAPLCLRKEVYPKCSSTSHHFHPHAPSSSLASLVSSFLLSPLAFLSKKSSRGHGDDSGYGASGSDLTAATLSTLPLLLNSSVSSRTANGSAFFGDAPHTPETSSLSSHCSLFDAVSIAADGGVVQQESEEIEQSSAVAEEKALSDSEIKTDNKQEDRRKVSSIRIRKTLPKPQYNLTPMGLPKAVRIKKKVFSVEEIYTNKNFTKPPEGRLETIFEVPFSRQDGSQSLIGPKRVKRFVEFPELGVARKPKRPLVGGAGGGGAPRKVAGNPGTGRTLRCRKAGAVQLQDLDSILCSKLEELDVWMTTEQLDACTGLT